MAREPGVPGVTQAGDGSLEIDLSVYDEGQPHWLSPLPAAPIPTKSVEKYSDDQPRVPAGHPDGGQWTSGGAGTATAEPEAARTQPASLNELLIDYKPDRPLTGPDSRAISEVIPGARTVDYFDVPGVDEMHRRMGIQPTLSTNPKVYMEARDRLFMALPVRSVPFSRLVYTQPRINLPEAQAITGRPGQMARPVYVIQTRDADYVMNGHHRVTASFLSESLDIKAHVLDVSHLGYGKAHGPARAPIPWLTWIDEATLRHYGPGDHPGTGTPQEVHGHGGGVEGGSTGSTGGADAEFLKPLMTLPGIESVGLKATHRYKTEAEVRAAVPDAQQAYERLLDKGDGIERRLGGVVVLAGEEDKAPAGKPFVVIVPPKGARAIEKVQMKYGGDWTRITDMVRGSIVVDKAVEVPRTFRAIKDEMSRQGWKLAAVPEDRMSKPDETGYRDVLLKMVAPNGLTVELQISTRAMLKAKNGDGHKYYERLRVLREQAALHGWSEAAKAEANSLVAKSAKLYNDAWEASQ